MHPALNHLEHRPWPIPAGPWTWRQSWHELLFAHWPIEPEQLRRFVPDSLEIDQFEGTTWLGVVPFRMTGVMRRPLPDLPWVSAFPELNVRIYVTREGQPGVWFLSLDASNRLAVWAARKFFHLPYHQARMSLRRDGDTIAYTSHREGAELVGWYRPISPVTLAAPGTLEHWLTERYCLYTTSPDGTLWRNEVHHPPWPLQSAEAELKTNTMAQFHGLTLTGPPAQLHYAERMDVVVWPGERIAV